MTSYKLPTIVLFTALVLAGCVSMGAYDAAEKGLAEARDASKNAPEYDQDPAIYVTEPAPNLSPIKRPEGPSWLHQKVAQPIEVAALPFDLAVEEVLASTGVVAKFGYDMNSGLLVSFSHDGTVGGALEKLSAKTNYSYSSMDNVVEWYAYQTRSFNIPVAGGDYSYMIGKDDQSQGQGGQGGGSQTMEQTLDTSAFDVDKRQYSNTKAQALNVFEDASRSLQSIVGQYGVVVPSESSSTIMVRTTPDRMKTVQDYIDNLMVELTSQVLLELKIVQVTTDDGADAGLDWSAVKETTRSQLSFLGSSPQEVFTNSVPVAFSGLRETGSGSIDVLLKALEQQGQVSFVTEQRVLARSGRLAELELADIQGYLAQSRVTQTTDVGTSQELIPGIVQGGYTLYTLSKVFGDRVAMAISTRSSDLAPFETVGTEDNFIQLPQMQSNRLNIQQIVTSGTTVVAATVRRSESASQRDSPLNANLAPTYAGAKNRVTDIIVLVTPRIITNI